MQPMLFHLCKSCTYHTPIPYSASVFSQNNACSHCGAMYQGVNLTDQATETANMQQEDLAHLFSQSMSLSNRDQSTQPLKQPPRERLPHRPPFITYASQHYTQSAHIMRQTPAESPSATTNQTETEFILKRNDIDPSTLFPAQITLFQNADEDQRLRLLELWRISPPTHDARALQTARQLNAQAETSLEREEALARMRYEHRQQEHPHPLEPPMEDDGMDVAEDEPPMHASTDESRQAAEPYVLSGYDALARRDYEEQANLLQESTRYNQATDPAFKGPSPAQKQDYQDMENQYGTFQYMRECDASGGVAVHEDGMIF